MILISPHETKETNLDIPVQHKSDLGHPTGQVKVARWAMTYPGIPLLDQLQLLFLQMHRVRKDRVIPQEMVVIVHPSIGYRLPWRKMSEKLLGLLNLCQVLRDMCLDGKGMI